MTKCTNIKLDGNDEFKLDDMDLDKYDKVPNNKKDNSKFDYYNIKNKFDED